MLLYTDESADEYETVTASLSIESSLIAFGLDASFLCLDHNSKSFVLNPDLTVSCGTQGTGLTIVAYQTKYRLVASIHDTFLYRNQASCGANLFILGNEHSSQFILNNITSMRGSCVNGCGLYYKHLRLISSNDANSVPPLFIMKSSFVNNYSFNNGSSIYALLGTAGAYTSYSFHYIWIAGCIFIGDSANNNLMKLYRAQTTNTSSTVVIKIENSLFQSYFCPEGIDGNVTLFVSNCSFSGINRAVTIEDNELRVENSTFGTSDSMGYPLVQSGIVAISGVVNFTGYIEFVNNNATKFGKGGALELYNSYFNAIAPVELRFVNNTASLFGGAIYVWDGIAPNKLPRCFFQITDLNGTIDKPQIEMYFEGNQAGKAGWTVYGGNIDNCILNCESIPHYNCSLTSSGTIFDAVSKYSSMDHESNSTCSSLPLSLCL